ncbi:MAG: iron-containing alcohol dehydrogenase [Zhongshania sp.]|uniref:iron-containing alcohol dehydrogenase n=1 Tax=Zhongshania sp. TaxID=1971902 RepID=UPI00262A32CB|nr:iron-containing alcohol dehydrogenase [Zhongshania sp.]MDF1693160.1 iron-containing alcohol dehydrogenase [Zhongshania sp.]
MSRTGYLQYNMRTVVHSGPGSIIRLPALFQGMGAKRVVLFSDQGLKQIGVVDQIVSVFENGQYGAGPELVGVYTDIAPDAACSNVNQALAYAREVAADAILAVGGGSVQDASKGVKYGLAHGMTDIRDATQSGIKLESWPAAKHMGIPHIGVATTAGTGAEVSAGAVFFNEELGIKSNLAAPFLDPDMAVLDANLTLGLPKHLTASTGMDALTHALEAVASPCANPFTDAHGFMAAQMIEHNLPIVTNNGKDVAARTAMLQASSMAIDAFVGALNAVPVHNCAHAFGAIYHIPHGDANSVLLPVCLQVLRDFYLPNAKRLAQALNVAITSDNNEVVMDAVMEKMSALQEATGVPVDFKKYNIPAEDYEKIAFAIATDPFAVFFPIPQDRISQIIALVV